MVSRQWWGVSEFGLKTPVSSLMDKVTNALKTPVVVFSKSYCPYCTMAKNALAKAGAKPLVFELDNMGNEGAEMQSAVANLSGIRTVPVVYVGGKCIGGGSDTEKLLKSGELAKLVAAAGTP